jgi:hypothetical protein
MSVNAGSCSRLCLNLFEHNKTKLVSCTAIGLTAASYTSYAWLLLVQYHVHLDLHGLGLLLPSVLHNFVM